jgi:hypothetical protein
MAEALTSSAASQPQSKALKAYLGGKQYQSKWNSYYSRIRVAATSLTANSYIVAAGAEVTAFSYGRQSDMASAGLPGTIATPADTNILTPNQTISGEAIEIMGLGLIVLGQSDGNLLKQLDQCCSLKIKMNGTMDYLMGIPSMVPSCGGLFGATEAQSVAPSLADQVSRNIGVISNGVPYISNYFPLPEPMMWVSAGKGDSSFNVILKVERQAATIPGYGSAARAAATGVAPYTPPAFGSVFVDWMVVIVGRTINPLSDN